MLAGISEPGKGSWTRVSGPQWGSLYSRSVLQSEPLVLMLPPHRLHHTTHLLLAH